MLKFRRPQPHPIALDVGNDSVKMLQLAATPGGVRVLAAAKQAVGEPPSGKRNGVPQFAGALQTMLEQAPFAGRNVVASLPHSMIHLRTLRLAPRTEGDLPAAVRAAASEMFPFDLSRAAVRFLDAGLVRQGADERREIIAIAACDQDVAAFLAQLHDAGLHALSLQPAPCAAYRCLELFPGGPEPEGEVVVRALIDVGATHSTVVIGRDADIAFIKSVEIGGQRLNQAVSRKLGITAQEAAQLRRRLASMPVTSGPRRDPVAGAAFDATRALLEELAHDVAIFFRYHAVTFRGKRVGSVTLVGGEAGDPHLRAALAGVLPVTPDIGRPILAIDASAMKPADRDGATGEWAVALGLALGAAPSAARVALGTSGSRPIRNNNRPSAELVGAAAATQTLAESLTE
ncbi:MAG: type pilus assembly protein PilM [Phycisphaerales bacterium]|nr:type pilus assembly protein PilM [Phycisphaerales bacterium]